MSKMALQFREARLTDSGAIVDINRSHLKRNSNSGFLLNKFSRSYVEALILQSPEHFFVSQSQEEDVLGFIQISNTTEFDGLSKVFWTDLTMKEIFDRRDKIYVEQIAVRIGCINQGVGRFLYRSLFQLYPRYMFYTFVASKPVKNIVSLTFHSKMGFLKAAVFRTLEFHGLTDYESFLLIKPSGLIG